MSLRTCVDLFFFLGYLCEVEGWGVGGCVCVYVHPHMHARAHMRTNASALVISLVCGSG